MFGVVPKTIWNRVMPADELNRVPLGFNCYVVETPANIVLIETGGGHRFTETQKERMNLPEIEPLPDRLRAYRIDTVINTHLHWDHCGGNMENYEPAFPDALYYTSQGEYDYAHLQNARDAVSYLDKNYDRLPNLRLTPSPTPTRLPPTHQEQACSTEPRPRTPEPAAGISLLTAPGHTANLQIVKITSDSQTFCFLSDLVPTAAHLKPTWIAAFDLDPLAAIESKTRILTQAAREHWHLGFGHDMNHAFVTVDENFKIKQTLAQ